MKLALTLMTEMSRRYGSGPGLRSVLDDAANQGRHGMDAPDQVQDGVEWWEDIEFNMCGPVPRMIKLRNGRYDN